MGLLARKIKENQYRLKLRQTLGNASIEELKITLDETRKELNRRNKKKCQY